MCPVASTLRAPLNVDIVLSWPRSNYNGIENWATIAADGYSVAFVNDVAVTSLAYVCEYDWACPAGHECVLGSSSQVFRCILPVRAACVRLPVAFAPARLPAPPPPPFTY